MNKYLCTTNSLIHQMMVKDNIRQIYRKFSLDYFLYLASNNYKYTFNDEFHRFRFSNGFNITLPILDVTSTYQNLNIITKYGFNSTLTKRIKNSFLMSIKALIDYFIRFSENPNGYFEKFNFENYI